MTGRDVQLTLDKRLVGLSRDLKYAVVDVGEGPAVVLLHGFPCTAALWRNQIPVLVQAGFRVIAPDLRGCGDSSKPAGVEHYRLLQIAGDVALLLRRLGVPRAHVVGHDWGAAVAWVFAAVMPKKVDRLVCVSVGHPATYFTRSLRQRSAAWHTLLFQFEGVAEELLSRDNWRMFREMLMSDGLSDDDVNERLAYLRQPGALTAILNWYRANTHPRMELESPVRLPFIRSPTLAIWGTGERFWLEEGVVGSSAYVLGEWRYVPIEGATHWVPLDRPDRLNELLLEFLDHHETTADAARPPRRRF